MSKAVSRPGGAASTAPTPGPHPPQKGLAPIMPDHFPFVHGLPGVS